MMSPRPTRLALLASAVLLAASLAGCVENVQDLKDRVTGLDEPVDTASTDTADGTGQVGLPAASDGVAKPPVARISVFGSDGAIVFKSSFAADETQLATLLTGGDTLTFSAADSEAVDPKATLAGYAWTVTSFSGATAVGHASHGDAASTTAEKDDAHAGHASAAEPATGASLQHTFPEDGGVFLVTLTVKDSLGATDAMALKIGVNPAPITRSVTFKGTIQAGTGHNVPSAVPVTVDASSHVFNVTGTVNDLPAMPALATLVLKGMGPTALDLDLDVIDPTGAAAGSSRGGSSDEKIDLVMPMVGDWTAIVSANVGVAADYELLVTVTYQPSHPDVVKAFGGAAAGGDGHGHAH